MTRMKDNSLSEEEFIAQAIKDETDIKTVLDACEYWYMSGSSDESSGDVESPTGFFYRAHRWVVTVDNQGFKELHTFDNEVEAGEYFDKLDNQFSEWEDESDD